MRNRFDLPIYVGKASSLKNRVRQYFQSSTKHTERIRKMISNICRFEYIVTGTETEALVLECTLIKKYKPKYNIMMKDGKTYPLIAIDMGEPYPRVQYTRKTENGNYMYFGPYPNPSAAKKIIEILSEIYPTRQCARLPDKAGSGRGCLNYEIGKCPGPCMGNVDKEQYAENISRIISFLKGDADETLHMLKEQMNAASEQMNFERAAALRDRIAGVKLITQRQRVAFADKTDRDVFAYTEDDGKFCVEVFFIRNGLVVGRDYNIADSSCECTGSDVLSSFLKQFYSEDVFVPEEIIIAEEIEDREAIEKWLCEKRGRRIHLTVPKIGEKRRLIEMAEENAKISMQQYKENIKKDAAVIYDATASLTRLLSLETVPDRIEAYDISNIGNMDIVGGMIVFTDGKPDGAQYRRFKIRSISEQNDYEAMAEMVLRRVTDGEKLGKIPDLIFVDGGRGHVQYVRKKLDGTNTDVPVFGIVKDNRHRTRAITSDTREYSISDNLQLMRFISSIQDEMHKYALSYNKSLRTKRMSNSSLDSIAGVGKARKQILFKHFGSVAAIKKASQEELQGVRGIDSRTAANVYRHFHGGDADGTLCDS